MFQTQQTVDTEMPPVVERADIAIGRIEDAGNGSSRAHHLGQTGADKIDLVGVGHAQGQIGTLHTRLKQHDRIAGRSADRLHVQPLAHAIECRP